MILTLVGRTDRRKNGLIVGRNYGQVDVPSLHIVSYFDGTDVFMSLHKPISTLTLTLLWVY